ncbi:MAG: hypothetical protein R3E60_07530 [Alphaproteobacteria bacterium]
MASCSDWKLDRICPAMMLTDTLIMRATALGAGMMKNPIPGAPSMWVPYVLVDDLKAATAKAQSLGAQFNEG